MRSWLSAPVTELYAAAEALGEILQEENEATRSAMEK